MKPLVLALTLALTAALSASARAQVQRIEKIYISPETTLSGPPIASINGRLYIAWTGLDPMHHLNLMVSMDGGHTFGGKITVMETSDSGPSLAAYKGRLYLAWRGQGNNMLNVAEVVLNPAGAPMRLAGKGTSVETTLSTPELRSSEDGLFISWRGVFNDLLNVARVDVR